MFQEGFAISGKEFRSRQCVWELGWAWLGFGPALGREPWEQHLVPGAPDVTLECLPGSPLPDQLRAAGYLVTETGTTQRILPHAIEQRFVVGAGGDLELATAGSTRPISRVTTHAGIVTTTVYDLRVSDQPPGRGQSLMGQKASRQPVPPCKNLDV